MNDVQFSFGSSEVRCMNKCIANGPQAFFMPWLELENILFQPAFLSAFPLFYVASNWEEGGENRTVLEEIMERTRPLADLCEL